MAYRNTYHRYRLDSTITITAGGTATRAIMVPRFMGIGGVLQFYFKLNITGGAPAITISAKPARTEVITEWVGTALTSAQYATVGGASAQTLTYFNGLVDTAFSAIVMTEGTWYMVKVDMGQRPWDAIELTFVESAGGDAAGAITGEVAIG